MKFRPICSCVFHHMFRCRGWRTLPMPPPVPPGRSVPTQSYDAQWVSSAQRGTCCTRMQSEPRVSHTSQKRPCCSQDAIFFAIFPKCFRKISLLAKRALLFFFFCLYAHVRGEHTTICFFFFWPANNKY